MLTNLVDRLRNECVSQSARCGEEDSQDRALLADEAANEIERLLKWQTRVRTEFENFQRGLSTFGELGSVIEGTSSQGKSVKEGQ